MAIELVEISDDQVALLIKTQEGHFLDFKAVEISPSSATKTVSAFANAAGGELFIGVDEVLGQSGFERRWHGFTNQEAANGLIQTLEGLSPLGNHPGGHLKIPHPWAGQTPPPDGGGTRG